MQSLLAVLAGAICGLSLGLIGGGGSILAVPLLLYIVGVSDPHSAIGTSALAVAGTACFNLWRHARARHVRWPTAVVFAVAGVCGSLLGSSVGKRINGDKLLVLFALLMIVIAYLMQLERKSVPTGPESHNFVGVAKLVAVGFPTGGLAGFFGIGGGFLIVPGLILAARIPLVDAIGSSLVSVGAFAATTAANYALSGLVEWKIAAEYIAGGAIGGWLGVSAAHRLAQTRSALNKVFGIVLVTIALYMLYRSRSEFT